MQVQSSKTKNTRLPYSRPLSSSIPHFLLHFLSLFIVQQQFLWACAGVTCTCMPLYTHMNRLKKYRSVPFNSSILSTIFVSPYLLLFSISFPFHLPTFSANILQCCSMLWYSESRVYCSLELLSLPVHLDTDHCHCFLWCQSYRQKPVTSTMLSLNHFDPNRSKFRLLFEYDKRPDL